MPDQRNDIPNPPALSEADIKLFKQLEEPRATTSKSSLQEQVAHRTRSTKHAFRIVWVLLAAFAVAFAVALFLYVQESQDIAMQQGGEVTADANSEEKTTTRTSEVLDLRGLLGLTEDAAIKAAGHGAKVTSRANDADDDAYSVLVEAVLTEEKSSVKNGPLKLYLGLDDSGKVVMAGYRAPFTVLGYGSYSFIEAVTKAHIVEQTLVEAGACKSVKSAGKLSLPDDESKYSTYEGDGATKVTQEKWFSGKADMDGVDRWKARLYYDFAEANSVGNLAHTRRSVEIYIYAN